MFFLFIFVPVPVSPSPPAVVVVVTDAETGSPLPGCRIYDRTDHGYEKLGITDENGELKFHHTEPGSVTVQRFGYRDGSAIRKGRTLEAKLRPIPLGSL